MQMIDLTYDPELKKEFHSGRLLETWARRYRRAFDSKAVALARARLRWGRLFNEWFTAVYYAKQGYHVLVGKYQFPQAHPHKAAEFRTAAPRRVVDLLIDNPRFGRRQGPDLFVYKPSREWFFVETKSPRERLSPGVAELFREIERRSNGGKIVLVRVVPRR